MWQPARGRGYRFNLDAILLAASVQPCRRVVDLGAGCGIIALWLLARGVCDEVVCVERQAIFVECLRRNAIANGFFERLQVIDSDLRQVERLSDADAVVLNPPYFPADTGRGSPYPGRDEARRELHGTILDFVTHAHRLAPHAASIHCIAPTDRVAVVLAHARALGLSVQRLRWIRARAGDQPRRVICSFDGQGTSEAPIEESLVIHEPGTRQFTPAVAALVS